MSEALIMERFKRALETVAATFGAATEDVLREQCEVAQSYEDALRRGDAPQMVVEIFTFKGGYRGFRIRFTPAPDGVKIVAPKRRGQWMADAYGNSIKED